MSSTNPTNPTNPNDERMRRVTVPMRGQPVDPYAYEVYGKLDYNELRILAARLSFMAACDTNVICDLAGLLHMDERALIAFMRVRTAELERELNRE